MIRALLKQAIMRIDDWLKQNNMTREADNRNYPTPGSVGSMKSARSISPNEFSGQNGMNFTVYGAAGGKVISFSTYDSRLDRTISSLYLITDKEDLGQELAEIITKESLSR